MNAANLSSSLFHVVLLIFSMMFTSVLAAPAAVQELVLLNWSEYLDPELIEKFEQQSGIKVKEAYFESDDLRDDMMLETDGKGFDLVMINGVTVQTYVKKGWLAQVGPARVPNLVHVDDHWRDMFPGTRDYAVPYFWGTLGIAYRADLVETPPKRWMDILRPDESLRGKIGMVESARELMGVALKSLGHSVNSADSNEIKAATTLLMEQKPYVKDYTYIALNEDSSLVSGEMVSAIVYSGDALMVREYNEEIAYVVPEEGSNLWVDYLAVLNGSNRKELAWKFINFLNEPENAAQLAEYVYYATPNKAAEELLPAEFLEDEIIYPNAAIMTKSEPFERLPARAEKKRQTAFARIMR